MHYVCRVHDWKLIRFGGQRYSEHATFSLITRDLLHFKAPHATNEEIRPRRVFANFASVKPEKRVMKLLGYALSVDKFTHRHAAFYERFIRLIPSLIVSIFYQIKKNENNLKRG